MRILRIKLRDFRGVTESEVEFGAHGITIIEGANEAGKSSLVEAFDLLLTRYADSQNGKVKAVRPTGTDADPFVEAELVTGDYHLTYRKRWSRRGLTELEIHSPRAESLVGREAHHRVDQILAETTDRTLWDALRVQQSEPLSQTALRDSTALRHALDLAAGGASVAPGATDEAADLLSRVQHEYERYYTPKGGKPAKGKELAATATELEAAQKSLEESERTRERIESDVKEHAKLGLELDRLETERVEGARELTRLTEHWRALEIRRHDVDAMQQASRAAMSESERAQRELAERQELAASVATLTSEVHELEARLAAGREDLTAARELEHARQITRDGLHSLVREARVHAELAADDSQHLRDVADLSELAARGERIDAIRREISAAVADLAEISIDTDLLTDIETANEQVVSAEAELRAASSRIHVEALRPISLDIAGARRDLAGGDVLQQEVTDSLEIAVVGTLRLRVEPGNGERDLRTSLDDARERFRLLCARGAVTDLDDARTTERRRGETVQRLAGHRQALEVELRGRTTDQLDEERVALTSRVQLYKRTRPAEPPLPLDVEAALVIGGEAGAAATRLEAELDAADAVAKTAHERARDADTSVQLVNQKLVDVRKRRDAAADALTGARAKDPDAALLATAAELRDRADAAAKDWQAALDALGNDDPAGVKARLENEHKVAERRDQILAERRGRRSELDTRLEADAGAHDDYGRAKADYERAQRDHDRVRRHAEAARLLRDTLSAHRDAVHRAYVEPFRTTVERLARIVFDDDMSLEIDDDLQITHRTLGGVTVPFDGLSAGAREQLCLCARLACAALVDESDGVPVVIDDALGYSDPDRLRGLGAVFNAVADRMQVIVLTCMPERYRTIGSATVRTL